MGSITGVQGTAYLPAVATAVVKPSAASAPKAQTTPATTTGPLAAGPAPAATAPASTLSASSKASTPTATATASTSAAAALAANPMNEIAQLAEASTFELQQMAQAGNQQAADLLAQKQQWTKLTSPPSPPAPGSAGLNILA